MANWHGEILQLTGLDIAAAAAASEEDPELERRLKKRYVDLGLDLRRYFQYSYIPRYNETLEIVEIHNDATEDLSGKRLEFGTPVQLKALPPEVQAEINISLGSSGMHYYTRTWWERKVVDFHAWKDRAGKRLQIWGLKLRVAYNNIRMAGIAIKYFFLKLPLRLKLARNWCTQRWQSFKIAVIDALLGDDK